MKNNLVHNRSGYLVIWPVIAALYIGCVLGFIFKSYLLSLVLLIVALVMTVARVWSKKSIERFGFSIRPSQTAAFPGETVAFDLQIKNEKLLPVMCAEVYFPLAKNLCLEPDVSRSVEDTEKVYLEELGASTEKVGEIKLPTMLWYETQTVKSVWTAKRRGIYTTAGCKLRTGDGFGLSLMEQTLEEKNGRQIAVYPKKIPVNTALFMRMAWSADTGARGVMDDNTVIRSTREYQLTDSVKQINWRLSARGLPLTVNTYEEILPQSVYFIFDGESFSGSEKHLEEMEDALSIVASVIIELDGKVRAGLGLSKDAGGECKEFLIGTDPEDLLWAMSGYEPLADLLNKDNKVIDRIPQFDLDAILEENQSAGRFYYVTYDAALLKNHVLLRELDTEKTTILSYKDSARFTGIETLCLEKIKEQEDAS